MRQRLATVTLLMEGTVSAPDLKCKLEFSLPILGRSLTETDCQQLRHVRARARENMSSGSHLPAHTYELSTIDSDQAQILACLFSESMPRRTRSANESACIFFIT